MKMLTHDYWYIRNLPSLHCGKYNLHSVVVTYSFLPVFCVKEAKHVTPLMTDRYSLQWAVGQLLL